MGQARRGPSAGPQMMLVPFPLFGAVHAVLQPCPGRAVPRSAHPSRGMLRRVGGCWWVLLGSTT